MTALLNFEQIKISRLALQMREGKKAAASELYDLLMPKVFGFCVTRIRDRMKAEDVTQDIFLKLINKIDQFDDKKGSFLSWFWQLARNTVIDSYRERSEVLISGDEDDPITNIATEDDTEESLDRKQRIEELYAFLSTLKGDERDLFELRFVSELSYEEIAEITGKNAGALRVAVSRIKDKVKIKLSRE